MGHPGGQLIVLGSGSTIPTARRTTSCYLVDDGAGTVLLVDLGPGTLSRAAAAGYDLDRIDAILLTHVHPDHCIDLATLQFSLRNPGPRPHQGPIRLFGHPRVGDVLAGLQATWPGWLEVGPERLVWTPVRPGPVPLPGATRARAYAIAHHASSLGYRLTLPGGFQLAFSGDATEGGELPELARDADLLVLEAAVADEETVEGHLTPRRAARVAAEAGARQLLLTHFYPSADGVPVEARVRESFEGPLTLAEDGMVLPLRR